MVDSLHLIKVEARSEKEMISSHSDHFSWVDLMKQFLTTVPISQDYMPQVRLYPLNLHWRQDMACWAYAILTQKLDRSLQIQYDIYLSEL